MEGGMKVSVLGGSRKGGGRNTESGESELSQIDRKQWVFLFYFKKKILDYFGIL